jgi:D-glycero-alpha-D-manno-heptose-7-phosphate kinase
MIITRAPLRISFFGGGTDFPEYFVQHGGAVLATAIDKFTYVTASAFFSQLFDFSIRASYNQRESVSQVADIQHPVIRVCLEKFGIHKGIELHTVADLPAFTGLGSSSSFTVGLLQALESYTGRYSAPLDLAYAAIDIERRRLGEAVGCQDQVIAAVGGFNVVEFRRETDIRVHRVPLSDARLRELESHMFLVFTGIKRRAAEVEKRKIDGICRHLETLKAMRAMVDEGHAILTGSRPVCEFGELLHRAWEAKRSLEGGVSNAAIDEMYQRGIAAGALGGKLLGAGGGGFILFFAPPERHLALRAAFHDCEPVPVRLDAPGSQVIFAGR